MGSHISKCCIYVCIFAKIKHAFEKVLICLAQVFFRQGNLNEAENRELIDLRRNLHNLAA